MITCWHYRRILSNRADTGEGLPADALEHIAGCPECRAHHAAETRIARELSATAGAHKQSPPPFLHARILSAVKHAAPTAEPAAHLSWRWSLALGTACVLLAAFLLWRHPPPSNDPAPRLVSVPAPKPDALPLAVQVNLDEWTARLDDPLEKEMRLVVSDTKAAVDSLANNFLPPEIRASLFDPSPRAN